MSVHRRAGGHVTSVTYGPHHRRCVCNNYNYDASQRSVSNPHSPGHYGSSFGHYGPQGQHPTKHTGDSPSSHGHYGPRGQDQDQGELWREHLTPQQKNDVDLLENMLKRGRKKSAKYRRFKKEEKTLETSLVDKSLSAMRCMKEVAMNNNEVAKKTLDKSLSTLESTLDKILSTLESTVDKSLSTTSDMTAANKEVAMDNTAAKKEVSKHAIDKAAAAHSPFIGKKRKHQISVDEVEIDSHKQARGTEPDIDSGMVRFADQHVTLTTALTVWEMMTTMSCRATQKENAVAHPIEDMERFTDQRDALDEMVHLKRELSKAEKEEVCQIGCAIVDQTLPEGPSASAIENEISRVLDMKQGQKEFGFKVEAENCKLVKLNSDEAKDDELAKLEVEGHEPAKCEHWVGHTDQQEELRTRTKSRASEMMTMGPRVVGRKCDLAIV